MSVYIRRLTIDEVRARQRLRNAAEVAQHNSRVLDALDLGPRPPRRKQVLDEFPPMTRRLAR